MAPGCKACNWVGGQLPCWVHRRVICWGLEPGFPLSLILHKYLLLIQTILLNLIKGLLIMIKSRAFIFSLFFHPFRESDVLPSPKTKIFLRYWFSGNQFFLYRIEIYLCKWCCMILFAGALQRNCISQWDNLVAISQLNFISTSITCNEV